MISTYTPLPAPHFVITVPATEHGKNPFAVASWCCKSTIRRSNQAVRTSAPRKFVLALLGWHGSSGRDRADDGWVSGRARLRIQHLDLLSSPHLFQQTKEAIGLLICFSPSWLKCFEIQQGGGSKSVRMLSRFSTLANSFKQTIQKCNTFASGSEYVNIYPILTAEQMINSFRSSSTSQRTKLDGTFITIFAPQCEWVLLKIKIAIADDSSTGQRPRNCFFKFKEKTVCKIDTVFDCIISWNINPQKVDSVTTRYKRWRNCPA